MALCKYDEHMMSLIPDYKPMSEKELRESMYRRGATDATMDQYLKSYDLVMEDIIQRGGFRVIGMKPQLGDPNVYTVCVPNSPYVLRMWEGGMTYYGHFCLDFYDTDRKAPVNLPAGHGLYSGGPSMPPVGFGSAPNRYLPYPKGVLDGMNSRPKVQAFGSWERNLGMSSIPEGEEKWSFPEGSCLVLKRDGHPDFTFQVPVRQAYFGVQAQTGFAYWR